MKKRIAATALAAVVSLSALPMTVAADASTKPDENRGTFLFDPGEWESSRVQFLIYDDTTEMYATKNGWTEDTPWTSEDAAGTKLENGLFESFEFEFPEGHEMSFQVCDPDNGGMSYYCDITPDVFGDIARIIPEVRYEGELSVPRYSGALKFDRTGIKVFREEPFYDTASGCIYFDASEWGSKEIDFYVYDVTDDKIKFATSDGWIEEDPWGTKKIRGSDCGNGLFSSYALDLVDDHETYVIISDPDNGHQTYECVLTVNCITGTATLTDEQLTAPSDSPELRHLTFPGRGNSTKLVIRPTGEIFGETVHPNADHEEPIAEFILKNLGTPAVTPENIAAAINAYKTTPELVWWKYTSYSSSEGYDEKGAREVLFPDESVDEPTAEQSDNDSETQSTASTSSAGSSTVTSPKTGSPSIGYLPIIAVIFLAFAFFARSRSQKDS